MIKKFKRRPDQKPFFRINERIFAHTLRVIGTDDKQIGILPRFEALAKAREANLDLVEIAPKATPPVARIVDYNKFLYQEAKRKREEKKKTKTSETKEVRLGPFMDDHDLAVMIRRAREFLTDNNKVRLVVKFVGRQIVHPEFGQQTLRKVLDALSDIAKTERDAHFEGKQLITVVSLDRKRSSGTKKETEETKNEEENKEINQ